MTPLTPEQQAREEIDKALDAAGWLLQDRAELNLSAGPGVAVREFQMANGHGFADYLLFVEGHAVGVLEAKPAGYPLTSVELQADKYATGLPAGLNPPVEPLPFLYMSTGVETRFIKAMSADVKGDAYEGLLEKNAQDVKGGAGQYFTPRAVIEAIVDCVQPQPGEIVVDPACGTGGFLLATHEYLKTHNELDRDQKKHLRFDALRGVELVPNVSRLCGMNLYLHGIGPGGGNDHEPSIKTDDSLRDEPKEHANVVLTNPPFGKKSSITVANEEGQTDRQALTYNRPDFWTTTSNRQLNFVQHVKSLLMIHGRAAVVVPDNVLFEGGAGETVRKNLLKECDAHTLFRLPTGLFYAQGVKANVLFFDRKPGAKEPWTKTVWVYDLRTNRHFTLKTKRMTRTDLDEFIACFRPGNRHNRVATWSEETPDGRWRPYSYDEVTNRDKVSLDLFWLRDESLEDSASLPDPHILAQEIAEDLRSALAQIDDVLGDLEARAMINKGGPT